MYKILNNFYKSNAFDKLPKILARKLFKIFKIFFVETNLERLPKNNHPTHLDREQQLRIINNENDRVVDPNKIREMLFSLINLLNICGEYINFPSI